MPANDQWVHPFQGEHRRPPASAGDLPRHGVNPFPQGIRQRRRPFRHAARRAHLQKAVQYFIQGARVQIEHPRRNRNRIHRPAHRSGIHLAEIAQILSQRQVRRRLPEPLRVQVIGAFAGCKDAAHLGFHFRAGHRRRINAAAADHANIRRGRRVVAQVGYADNLLAQPQSEQYLSAAGKQRANTHGLLTSSAWQRSSVAAKYG